MYKKINNCRISDDKNLISLFNPKNITLTGEFPKKKFTKIQKTPLEVVFSKKSGLVQLNHNYNQEKLFGNNYGYRSGLNSSMVKHLKDKAKKISKLMHLNKNDFILDIGSNDGTFLGFFSNNIKKIGVDPTAKKFKKFYKSNIKTINKVFTNNTFNKNYNKKFKLISAMAMFYDLKDPIGFCKNINKILEDDGIFHVEIAYLPDIIKYLSFDTFCQEHLTYFSLHSFNKMLEQTNFKITDMGRNSINGGSIWFNLSKKKSNKFQIKKKEINNLLKKEIKKKINSIQSYRNFFKQINMNIKKIKKKIIHIKKNKQTIYGFGASTKGNSILQFCQINQNHLDCVLDVNKDKYEKFTPGTNIIIKDEKILKYKKPDYIFILIWHFKESIKSKLKKYINNGGKLIMPFPKMRIIKKI